MASDHEGEPIPGVATAGVASHGRRVVARPSLVGVDHAQQGLSSRRPDASRPRGADADAPQSQSSNGHKTTGTDE